jgi:hypothetical protein
MKESDVRRLLQTAPLADEFEARRRSWLVVRSAFAERAPARRRLPLRALALAGAVIALVAAALSPPGMALIDRVRDRIGVEDAEPGLFRLPAPGHLLVVSDAGAWVVARDGSSRLLGPYREASWSPFGRFVVAARRNELAALEPDGDVRWKLARRDVRFPRWQGSRTDTRIAYLSRGQLRVVGGDGKGDRAACAGRVAPVPPAWRPGTGRVLAAVSPRGRVLVYATDRCRLLMRSAAFDAPRTLAWSDDGRRLVLVTAERVLVFGPGRSRPLGQRPIAGTVDAAFAPGSRRLAVVRDQDVLVLDVDRPSRAPRTLFAGPGGRLSDVAWSPDARWLLIAWRDADQWVFVRSAGERRLAAASNIAAQFESRAFPRVAGWCCAR